jgi:hypothetical protein
MPLDLTVMEIFSGMYEDRDFYLQEDIYGCTLLENFIDNRNIKSIYALRVNQNSYSVPEEFRREFKEAFNDMFEDDDYDEDEIEQIIFESSDFIWYYNYALKTGAGNDVLRALRSLIHCGDERNYNLFLEKNYTKKLRISSDDTNRMLKIISFFINAQDYDGLKKICAESLIYNVHLCPSTMELVMGMVQMIENRYFWAIVHKYLSTGNLDEDIEKAAPIFINMIQRRIVPEDLELSYFELYRLMRE